MDEIRVELEGLLNMYAKMHNSFSNELKQYPQGTLYSYCRNGHSNYIWNKNENGRNIRQGITRDPNQIHQLSRKAFVEEADDRITNNIRILDMALRRLKPIDGDSIINELSQAYRGLPENFFLTRPLDMTKPVNMTKPLDMTRSLDMDVSLKSGRNEGRDDGKAEGRNEGRDEGILVPANNKRSGNQDGYHKLANGIYVPNSLREAAMQGTLSSSQREQIREIQREWANQDYPKNTKNLEQRKVITSQGLKVRSMAEGSITESLYEHDVPFRHDQIVTIGNQTVSPDFSFLSIIRGEIYWEHCGLTNSRKYIDYQRYKRSLYESISFVPWKNFIITFNEEDGFFDTREMEAIIENKLMRWLYLD